MKGVVFWATTAVGVRMILQRSIPISDNLSSGQIGRALGPLVFCTLYWWAGRQFAYLVGGTGMVAVAGLVFGALQKPAGTENVGKRKVKAI
jgi:hypothetical protein